MSKKKNSERSRNISPRKEAFDTAWEKFEPLIPEEELPALKACIQFTPDPAIRLNPQKASISDIGKLRERYHWDTEPVAFCPDGYKLKDTHGITPGQTNEHRCGAFYIQDSASMLPVTLFDREKIQNKPLILDMAASPGGKTTQLSAASRDSGLILANDSSASRITILKKVMKNWGSIHHLITVFPGEFFGQWYPNTFALVLLDAPCSMQSLVSIASHPMRPISEREENALAQRQLSLLDSALKAVKPGGQVVYSTCTLSPTEDESVINGILKKYGAQITLLDAQQKLPYPAPGLVSVEGSEPNPSLERTIRLWPHRYQTTGFFAALIQKNDTFGFSEQIEKPFRRSREELRFVEIDPRQDHHPIERMNEIFGFNLTEFAEQRECCFRMRGNELWAIPTVFFDESVDWPPCKSCGMRVAAQTASGWLPDFDWVSLVFDRISQNRYPLDETLAEAWVRGEDLPISLPEHSKGTILFMTDSWNVFIGCGYVSGNRIRNLTK